MPIAFTPTETEGKDGSPLVPRGNRAAFALVTGLFFLWGIPNNLNDVLIRQFMKAFEITRLQAGLVQSAFYIGYFVMSIPAAIVMRRYGYKRGLQVGLLLYASGTFLFLPAAHTSSYALFLIALFVIATGLGFLETGANPLVTQLGDAHSSVRRLNFSQAFNPLGSIMGVLIGTVFIFSGVELSPAQIEHLKAAGEYGQYLHAETLRVLAPYLALGVIVLVWALLLSKTPFPEVDTNRSGGSDEMSQGGYSQLLNYPHTLLAVLAQFCYVGAQVGTWSYFIQYVQDYTHVSEKTAGYLLTGTLVGFAVGRFTSSQVMRVVEPGRLMGIFALVNHCASCGKYGGTWMVRYNSAVQHELFHVSHVSHHLRPRTSGIGAKYQACLFPHRNGHHWWRSVYATHGLCIRGLAQYGAGNGDPARVLPACGGIRVLGF
jgi:FHS family L-fucose permease-like MFS transporter